MKNLELLDSNYTESLTIKLTKSFQNEVWQEIADISNEVTRHRSYINLLARKAFVSWLSLILEEEITDNYYLEKYLSIWEFINGNDININLSRIVLIPTEIDDKSEISIPKEWMTIPEWVGNYYVAVEVNLAQEYLSFWGYTSYKEIINNSELDLINYHHDLEAEYLETDLNLMALEYEYGWENIPQIKPLSLVSKQQKYKLLSQIKDELFPRYCLNFSQWLNLISDLEIRSSLFKSRQPIRLSQWLNRQIESTIVQGWQNIENVIDNLFISDLSLQPSFSARRRPISLPEAIDILKQNDDSALVNDTLAIIPSLAQCDREQVEIIDALVDLITNSDDEEIRWNGALSLEKLSNKHPCCPLWYSKEVNIADNKIVLLIGILPKNNEQLSIFVRVYGLENKSYLPNNLKLQIIDENDDIYYEVISNKYDNIIQYKFWGNQGEKNSNLK